MRLDILQIPEGASAKRQEEAERARSTSKGNNNKDKDIAIIKKATKQHRNVGRRSGFRKWPPSARPIYFSLALFLTFSQPSLSRNDSIQPNCTNLNLCAFNSLNQTQPSIQTSDAIQNAVPPQAKTSDTNDSCRRKLLGSLIASMHCAVCTLQSAVGCWECARQLQMSQAKCKSVTAVTEPEQSTSLIDSACPVQR